MLTFSVLLKKIRQESGVTQAELAKILGVSKILISMIEVNQREVSKGFVNSLANAMDVHPSTISPFIYYDFGINRKHLTQPERSLIALGERLQDFLIQKKAKNLRRYVKKK